MRETASTLELRIKCPSCQHICPFRGEIIDCSKHEPPKKTEVAVYGKPMGKIIGHTTCTTSLHIKCSSCIHVFVCPFSGEMMDCSHHELPKAEPKQTVCDKCGQDLPDKTDWQCGDCGHWNSYKVGRCVACHDEKNHKPKRVYTEAQIQEAKDIVYRLIMQTDKAELYEVDPCDWRKETRAIRIVYIGAKKWEEKETAVAKCADDDTWNDHIGIMVAVCKLTETKMPTWVRGQRIANKEDV